MLRHKKGYTLAPRINFKIGMKKSDSLLSLAAGSWHLPQLVGKSDALSDLPEVTEDIFHRAGKTAYVS